MAKKWKITNFRDEFFSGSSDFKDGIWWEMESLGVLDVFCTVFECATTSRFKFTILPIFAIFWFLISGFWQFDHRNFDDFYLWVPFFSKSIIIKLFQKKCHSSCALFRSLQPFRYFPNFPTTYFWKVPVIRSHKGRSRIRYPQMRIPPQVDISKWMHLIIDSRLHAIS